MFCRMAKLEAQRCVSNFERRTAGICVSLILCKGTQIPAPRFSGLRYRFGIFPQKLLRKDVQQKQFL